MAEFNEKELDVLRRHFKAICHLRERKASDRIALFLGAGVSKPIGLPSWKELLDNIEKHEYFKKFKYSGNLESMACLVEDYVFNDLNAELEL